jgi:hypothetical protein
MTMGTKQQGIGGTMTNEDRHLLVETLAEMRELKGEMKEFKDHVMGRVERLEKKEGDRTRNLFSALSLFASMAALAVSIIINFFRQGNR